MARPRVFVSSTFYDLKHIRSSMENFIESLGYDAILSEKGDIAYTPDVALDESCYREAENADIYVLIIGGRYGAEVSADRQDDEKRTKQFYERYESITKREYEAAAKKDIPIYVLIEAPVYSELRTFQKNKENQSIEYAHVDSVNIFHFVEEILAKPRNNPVQSFEKYAEIEVWLREQWAGYFRELLQRRSTEKQLTSLSAKVAELSEINQTLKTYLETVITEVAPKGSTEVIAREQKRLEQKELESRFKAIGFYEVIETATNMTIPELIEVLKSSPDLRSFIKEMNRVGVPTDFCRKEIDAIDKGRVLLGLAPYSDVSLD